MYCLICFILFSASKMLSVNSVSVGPAHPATTGAVWPKPQTQTFQNGHYTFDPDRFSVEVPGNNCTILLNRIHHYMNQFRQMKKLCEKYKDASTPAVRREKQDTESAQEFEGFIHTLRVDLLAPCEEHPYLDMDESYNLTVTTSAKLTSASLWGIIRGLETFSQLFYFTDDFMEIRINATEISDAPAYKHRGLLLDTSRHFIPVQDILITIDALAINKMNVFHWHIVDDQSFPYQSEKFPDLSARGAYHKSMVYTRSDIDMIVNYATERGVRVIPEFDMPGHTLSWGLAYPNLLTKCYTNGKVSGLGPMNPIKNTTYMLLRDLFQEVQDVFPDHYIHVGGDEVIMECWQSNPEIVKWMKENDIQSASKLHSYFMSRTLPLLQPRSEAIVWQDVFEDGVELKNNTVIHIWKSWTNFASTMKKALEQGYRILFSSLWYLDHATETFEKMLQRDPRMFVFNDTTLNLKNVLGGEACMWGELVDDTNMHSRIWPRASAVAERLWSGPPNAATEQTTRRAEEHTCRMKRRGVPAAPPSGPGFCLT